MKTLCAKNIHLTVTMVTCSVNF